MFEEGGFEWKWRDEKGFLKKALEVEGFDDMSCKLPCPYGFNLPILWNQIMSWSNALQKIQSKHKINKYTHR